ncbi:MAG: copper amine oxidase N-terminal domain-containing protein [Firmicutes bacterium]|nr:copper amine oxidase N-terminal domain-containing protein [Bacillota bacterium]
MIIISNNYLYKLLKIFLSVVIAIFMFSIIAFGVEIKFKVGDNTLSVNGEDIKVKKPFVINGTTLVPLRVVLEAFGSKVIWHDDDMSIDLKLDDISIKIQIDSDIVIVNETKQKLPQAPLLVEDTTMVPLRFISENFGSIVSYDENTQQIKVVKQEPKDYKYYNKTAKYNIMFPDGWEINDKVASDIKLCKNDAKVNIHIYATSYLNNITLDTITNEFIEQVDSYKNREKLKSAKSERIIGSTLAKTANCNYIKNSVLFNDTLICFEQGAYTYEISGHFNGKSLEHDKAEFEQMIKTAVFEMIPQNTANIFLKNHRDTFYSNDKNFKIDVPLGWEVDLDGEKYSAFNDDCKIEIETYDIKNLIDADQKAWKGSVDEFKLLAEDEYLEKYYANIFKERGGITPTFRFKYTYSYGGQYPRYLTIDINKTFMVDEYGREKQVSNDLPAQVEEGKVVLRPTDIPNFYKKSKVYPFIAKTKDMETSPIYYVFRKGNILMTATCQQNVLFNEKYNRKFYDEIIKSIIQE